MPRIAFFDVDNTVIAENSATRWLRREVRGGHISRWQAARGALWIALYALGLSPMERAIEDAVGMLRGRRERDVHDRTILFYNEEVRALIRPGARAAVEEHRKRGDLLYLLTTSSTYMSALLAEELGFDGYLCNRLEVIDGSFSGVIEPPLCYGKGKVVRARALAGELGADLADCACYTDSYSDLPILLAVGQPVVVNPDMRLLRFAARRGWPVRDWGLPGRVRG